MSKTQYLSEEKYQLNKKKITVVAILVLIIGLLVGGGLIATGLRKNSQAKLRKEEINEVQVEIYHYNLDSQIDKFETKLMNLLVSLLLIILILKAKKFMKTIF